MTFYEKPVKLCPHCGGYTITNKDYCVVCETDEPFIVSNHPLQYYRVKAKKEYGAKSLWTEILNEELKERGINLEIDLSDNPELKAKVEEFNKVHLRIIEEHEFLLEKSDNQNRLRCPACGSTNISKITATKKAVGFALFGILSTDARKQLKCNSCGYKF